jgi:hypothetical protein
VVLKAEVVACHGLHRAADLLFHIDLKLLPVVLVTVLAVVKGYPDLAGAVGGRDDVGDVLRACRRPQRNKCRQACECDSENEHQGERFFQ